MSDAAATNLAFDLSRDLFDLHDEWCDVCPEEGCCCSCGLLDGIEVAVRKRFRVETCDGNGRYCLECREKKPSSRSEGRHHGCHTRLVTEWSNA